MGRTKLTDKQKKKIIADYIINNNLSETARMNKTTPTTVQRIIDSSKEETLNKVNQKEEDNTKDILEYIDFKLNKQKSVIELSLEVLEQKLSKPDAFTNVKDVATVFGIFTDKALKSKELKLREKELELKNKEDQEVMNKLDELLEAQKHA